MTDLQQLTYLYGVVIGEFFATPFDSPQSDVYSAWLDAAKAEISRLQALQDAAQPQARIEAWSALLGGRARRALHERMEAGR